MRSRVLVLDVNCQLAVHEFQASALWQSSLCASRTRTQTLPERLRPHKAHLDSSLCRDAWCALELIGVRLELNAPTLSRVDRSARSIGQALKHLKALQGTQSETSRFEQLATHSSQLRCAFDRRDESSQSTMSAADRRDRRSDLVQCASCCEVARWWWRQREASKQHELKKSSETL